MAKKLVAYFSAGGTTKKIAEQIAEAGNADLCKIPLQSDAFRFAHRPKRRNGKMNPSASQIVRNRNSGMQKAAYTTFTAHFQNFFCQHLILFIRQTFLSQNHCMRMQMNHLLHLFQKIALHQCAVCDRNGMFILFTHKYNHSEPAASRPAPYHHTFY